MILCPGKDEELSREDVKMRSVRRLAEQFTMDNDNSKALRSMAACEFLFGPVLTILDSRTIQASINFTGQLLEMDCEPELDTTDTLIYFMDHVVRRLNIAQKESHHKGA
jgi:hypothetical protein